MTTAFIYPSEKNFHEREESRALPRRAESRRRPRAPSALRVLIVVEDENRFEHLRAQCTEAPHEPGAVHWLVHYETARDALFREAYDVAVLDSHHHGLALLRDMARGGTDTPAVVLVDDDTLTRDAAGVICEFLSRDAVDSGRLRNAVHTAVARAGKVREATRSQAWWRCGGRTLSHAIAFPAPPETHGNLFVSATVPDAPPYLVQVGQAGASSRTSHSRRDGEKIEGERNELHRLLNQLPVIAGRVDEDGTILDCGGSGLAVLGVSPEMVRGQNIFTLPGVPTSALRQAARGTPVKFVCSCEWEGGMRHFECHLRFDGTRPGGVVGFAFDVTDRVEAERSREPREQLLAGIIQHVPAIVGRIDESGRICQVEGTGLGARGLDPRHLLRAQFVTLFPFTEKAVGCALAGGSMRLDANVRPGTADEWRAECTLFFDRERGAGAMFFVQDITVRRAAERQLVQAVDAERQRIGADLHDDVGQLLTGIACLSTALVERLRGRDDLAAEDASTVASVANDALAQVRSLARGLTPMGRAHQGLSGALEDLREQVRRMHDVDVYVQIPSDCVTFDRDTAAHLVRIVQEAIANAIRHGEATRIEVSLRHCGGQHRLTIADNGCGFDPEIAGRTTGSGLGLMEYRAALIGGSFKVSSDRKAGTRIEILFNPTNSCPHENAC